jgi:hypothetical protein
MHRIGRRMRSPRPDRRTLHVNRNRTADKGHTARSARGVGCGDDGRVVDGVATGALEQAGRVGWDVAVGRIPRLMTALRCSIRGGNGCYRQISVTKPAM